MPKFPPRKLNGSPVLAFAGRQTKLLEELVEPGQRRPRKVLFAAIARAAGISTSHAERAWRGYTVLGADVWERVAAKVEQKAALQAARTRRVEDEAREDFRSILAELRRLHARLDKIEEDGDR